MDWKSTAVISGAGILATWFFSMPATHPSATASAVPATPARQTAASTIDIEQEAARLQVRVHQEPRYVGPSRNPFSFGGRSGSAARPPTPSQPAAVVPLPPALPRIALDGIATDMVGGQEQRTAILNTDAGLVLAREGEEVAGYRVEKIASDAVELVKLSDGSVLHIALR